MKKYNRNSALRNEEQRTNIWFITLFYLILTTYDAFYYFIRPKYLLGREEVGFPNASYYWIYVIMFGIIPLIFYLNKNKKEYLIKYIYSISYIILIFITELITYFGKDIQYNSGNLAELFLVLFAPIFVNSRFLWIVVLGTMSKYILLTLCLSSPETLFAATIVFILAVISFILLNRFKGYVAAVKSSYNQQLEGIVKGVIATLELKDPYTRGHSERVAGYAQILARETGLFSKDQLEGFYYACLLHDIGKIHIPDQILAKPSKLTTEEYEVIKSHPVVGAEAVKDVEGLTENIDVIRSHHERWDGKGYPDCLKGTEIPILARVVAIADAFDAMTSSRSYRSAMPLAEAYQNIIEGKGTQFDPELVEEFVKVFPQWTKFHNSIQ
ncbi:HD-GYP domain-containing protein [Pseudoneobacillus sp. C159]